MKKIKLTTILSILITMLMVVCFACDKIDEYTLNTNNFEAVVEYNGEVDISNIIIYDNQSQCEISSDEFEIISCDDTDTIGKKLLVIQYKNQTYSIPFEVKYKVEFVVDGEAIDTQYVTSSDEIVIPNSPIKQGYDFINWDNEIPQNLDDNIVLTAIFSSTTLPIPTLNTITVDYGTTLNQIELPSNENGVWEFEDELTTEVGNVGKRQFAVKFVPTTTELVERYDEVTVNVSPKNLQFTIIEDNFIYDGEAHFPEYSLPVDVNVNVVGEAQINASDNAYDYALIIVDTNYSGFYTGQFTISKADVTIKVADKVVDYAQSFKMTYEVEGFDNVELLGITLDTPTILNAGSYDIGVSITNTNVNLKVVSGTLTINKIDINPAPVNPTLSSVSKAGVYGDKLSSITFENNYSNGTWSWKEPNAIIDKIDGFKAVAVFTPKSLNYNILERELNIDNINKKTLNIVVTDNIFIYDGNEHTIAYQIEDGSYSNVEVVGNIAQINAGEYSVTLTIDNEFYQGMVDTNLTINKATPETDFSSQYVSTWFAGITLNNIKLNDGYVWKQPTTCLNNVGTNMFDAQFIPADTSNYNIIDGQFEVTITKANANISNVKSCYNFVYTGNVHNISGVIPSHYESALQYSYTYQNESVDNLINAGTYEVSIVLPESEHYNRAEVTTMSIIDKASADVILQTLTATYEDTLAQVNLPIDEDGVWTWKEDLSTSVGNAGAQTHIAIYTSNNINYQTTEIEVTIEVTKKTLSFEILNNTYVYDGKAHGVEFVIVDDNDKEYTDLTVSGNVQVVNAGTYNLVLNIESDNYAGTKSAQLIITKAEVILDIPTYSALYMNVDDIKTMGTPVAKNSNNQLVAGNWVYGELNYVHGENASSFTLTFNPSDTLNYVTSSTTVKLTIKSVAHIETTYYATIESALAVAVSGDDVFVDADTTGKVKITQNCEIKTGVTLVLPYGADTCRTTDGKATLSDKAYGTLSELTDNCKNIITINDGITLTNNGTLDIAGEVSAGAAGYPYAGHTARYHAKLVMDANSTINSNGTIKCTGFIYEATLNNGSQININKGSIELPFVIRDFRGGSYMYATYMGVKSGLLSRTSQEASPFNEYQVRNISSKIIINYSGSMVGYANLYASSKVNFSKVNFVGNTSSFMMQFNDSTYSYLEAKYNPDNDINYWDFYGGMKLNAMSLTISGTTINTSKLYFPLNWCFNMSLNQSPSQTTTATYDLQQKLKMLPGSVMTINKGASATFSNLNIYTTFNDTSNIGAKYPTKSAAQLIINGSVTANNLGGNIYSTTSGAMVTINSNVSITTKEADGAVSGSSIFATIGFQSITNTATFYYGDTKLVATSTGTYKFDGSKWAL